MKKLIAVLLILAVLIPVTAIAERDPIVGTWYIYSGIVDDSELREQAYFELSLFHFTEDGNIFSSTYDVSDKGITTVKDYKVIGLWTVKDGKYFVNIWMTGAKEVEIEANSIFIPVNDYYIRIKKLDEVNYVTDMKM